MFKLATAYTWSASYAVRWHNRRRQRLVLQASSNCTAVRGLDTVVHLNLQDVPPLQELSVPHTVLACWLTCAYIGAALHNQLRHCVLFCMFVSEGTAGYSMPANWSSAMQKTVGGLGSSCCLGDS